MMEINTEYQTTFTMENATINEDLFFKLLGINQKPKWSLSYDHQVQCRKHRKKRINKKWAKRYGYKTERVELNGFEFEQQNENEFTFVRKEYEK